VTGDCSLVLLPCLLAALPSSISFWAPTKHAGLVLISWLEIKCQVSVAILCSSSKTEPIIFSPTKKTTSLSTISATLDIKRSPVIMPS